MTSVYKTSGATGALKPLTIYRPSMCSASLRARCIAGIYTPNATVWTLSGSGLLTWSGKDFTDVLDQHLPSRVSEKIVRETHAKALTNIQAITSRARAHYTLQERAA